MVMLTFFVVIVLDNLLVWHSNRTIVRMTSTTYGDGNGRKTLETDDESGDRSGQGSEDIERADRDAEMNAERA
jgi:hypothetical protein